nr:MAG TPA: hypothetical protein [Caudoviricetes sp.]
MLTKKERKAIAERIGEEFDCTENDEVYEALIGEEIPDNTTWATDCKVVRNRLIELCDTSNMVELPLDKDGEVIHIGDTVFDNDGAEISVFSIRFNGSRNNVVITCEGSDFVCTYAGDNLTHKNPVSVQSISKRMQDVLEYYLFSVDSNLYTELVSIAGQLKELASKDE